MAIHQDLDSLCKELEEVTHRTIVDDMSENLIEIWTQLLWEEFYMKYEPKTYERSYQLLASIAVLNASKSGSGKTFLNIGYDPRLLEEGKNGNWNMHEDKDVLGDIVEYGDPLGKQGVGMLGHNPIRAIDDMVRYANSEAFAKRFSALMRAKGY